MEMETREPEEKSWISQKLVRAVVIGASLVGLGAWLFGKRLQSHTIPPIIIKSVDGDIEPIEIESTTTLAESASLATERIETESTTLAENKSLAYDEILAPAQNVYTLHGFGVTRSVKVRMKNTVTGTTAPLEEYSDNAGLAVKLWLQHKTGSVWQDEPQGPHLETEGATVDFRLICDRLSQDKPNGNPIRRRKRSYNKNKNWRIGAVQVGNNPKISTTGNNDIVIEFANHFH